jgi:hypothetical protein
VRSNGDELGDDARDKKKKMVKKREYLFFNEVISMLRDIFII